MPVATKYYVMGLKKEANSIHIIQAAQNPAAQTLVWSYFRKKKVKGQQRS